MANRITTPVRFPSPAFEQHTNITSRRFLEDFNGFDATPVSALPESNVGGGFDATGPADLVPGFSPTSPTPAQNTAAHAAVGGGWQAPAGSFVPQSSAASAPAWCAVFPGPGCTTDTAQPVTASGQTPAAYDWIWLLLGVLVVGIGLWAILK